MRLHWHADVTTLPAGDYRAGYWRGPAGCPPECLGPKPPYTWSQAIPEGREGLPPRRDDSWKRVTPGDRRVPAPEVDRRPQMAVVVVRGDGLRTGRLLAGPVNIKARVG